MRGGRAGMQPRLLRAALAATVTTNEAVRLGRRVSNPTAVSGGPNVTQNCSAPDEVHERLQKQGLALLSTGTTYALYGIDEDDPDSRDEEDKEVALTMFDCTNGKQLVFVHIPKNAGSAITQLGKHFGMPWGAQYGGVPQTMPDGNQCMPWHVPPALKLPPNPYVNPLAEVFCVVRDPWQRMRSEYVYVIANKHRWPQHHADHGPMCTTEGFNLWAIGSLVDVQGGSRYQCGCHLVPQWEFVEGLDGHRWCQHVLPMEELTPKFNQLMSSHGLKMRMKPYMTSNEAYLCPELREMPLSQVYWRRTQELMRAVYRQDFEHLGDTLHSEGWAGGPALLNTSGLEPAAPRALSRATSELIGPGELFKLMQARKAMVPN